MPVGIFAHNEVCSNCLRINKIIETAFLVCQHCKAIQGDNLQRELAHFNKWLKEPVNGLWIFYTSPLELLALHQRLGGSRHRFDHQHGESRLTPTLHPTYEPCRVCGGKPPEYPATCSGCSDKVTNLGFVPKSQS